MAVVSKQTLLDYFCSGGQAKHATSTIESELEDLIDTLFASSGGYTYMFVPALRGWDNTGSGYIGLTFSSGPQGVVMDETNDIAAYGWFLTPTSFTGDVTVTAVYRTVNGSGNLMMRNFIQVVDYFTPGMGTPVTGTTTTFAGATAAGAYKVLPLSTTITSQALIRVYTYRFGSQANDTYDQDIYFLGWEVAYT
jgi:hypothetical protein